MPNYPGALISDSESDDSMASIGSARSRNSAGASARDDDDDDDEDFYIAPRFIPKSDSPLPEFQTACDEYTGADEDGFSDELKPGVKYYLVEHRFCEDVHAWLQGNADAPDGCVDNTPLCKNHEPGAVRADLEFNVDYSLVKKAQWDLLMDWFGGGPELGRVAYRTPEGNVAIDLSGVHVFVKRADGADVHLRRVSLTRDEKVSSLKRRLCEDLYRDVDPKQVRLEVFEGLKQKGRLTPYHALLSLFDLRDDDVIVVSVDDGAATESPPPPSAPATANGWHSSPSPFSSSSPQQNRVVQAGEPPVRGAVGLCNLGNTCFMNSTLQCLSNLPALRHHFESGEYAADVNLSNPLGTRGRLARSFGDLMRAMWSEGVTVVSPLDTKAVIVSKKPVFQGYHQHDSQELLIFILDILHEDVNKIVDKPLTTAVESDGDADDAQVAAEARRVFHLRNDSFINDLTECYLKSTVVCPEPACHRVSVRFDQCTCLTLPVSKASQHNMTVLPITLWDASAVQKPYGEGFTSLRVPADSTFFDVRLALAEALDVSAESIVLGTVYRHAVQNKAVLHAPLRSDVFALTRIFKGDEVVAYIHAGFAQWRREAVWAADYHPGFQPAAEPAVACAVWPGEVWLGTWDDSLCRVDVRAVDDGGRVVADLECVSFGKARVEGTVQTGTGSLELKSPDGDFVFSGVATNELTFVNPGRVLMYRYREEEKRSCMLVHCRPEPEHGRFPASWAQNPRLTETVVLVTQRPVSGPQLMDLVGADARIMHVFKAVYPSVPLVSVDVLNEDDVELKLEWRPAAGGGGGDNDDGEDEKTQPPAATELAAAAAQEPAMSIYECLDLFTMEEQLSQSEAWYCPSCKEHKEAFKKMQLWSLAPVLVVHLKRFSQTESSYFVDKDDAFVEYPLEGLDLNARVLGPSDGVDYVYDLAGVSHHFGGLGGGHYTATCRNVLDGQWYLFDDSHVTLIGSTADEARSRVCAASGYVLYYVRRDAVQWGRPASVAPSPSPSPQHPVRQPHRRVDDDLDGFA